MEVFKLREFVQIAVAHANSYSRLKILIFK